MSDTPIACNKEKVYDFVHKNAKSLGQLMPIYENAITRNGVDITKDLIEKNNFLIALNQGSAYGGETYSLPESIPDLISKLFVFGSNDQITLTELKVGLENSNNMLYRDGTVISQVDGNGDGTVPEKSASFLQHPTAVISGEHGKLTTQIISFINNLIN